MSDGFTFKMKFDTKPLETMSKNVTGKLTKVVRKNALEMEARTKTSQSMPVDTGALRDSIEAESTDQPLTWEVHDGVEVLRAALAQ